MCPFSAVSVDSGMDPQRIPELEAITGSEIHGPGRQTADQATLYPGGTRVSDDHPGLSALIDPHVLLCIINENKKHVPHHI